MWWNSFDDNGMGTTEALDLYADYDEKKVILGPWMHSGNANYDIHGFALGNNTLTLVGEILLHIEINGVLVCIYCKNFVAELSFATGVFTFDIVNCDFH